MGLYRVAFASLLIVWAVLSSAAQTEVPIPPPPTRWVTDTANFLSPEAAQRLDRQLEAYERQTGRQILVWIGSTTGIVPIEDWAVRTFASWKVGRKGIDDGLVLFIMAEDRRLRIEVGYGLEGDIPDSLAGRIINQVIVPQIRAGNNDQAVADGLGAIIGVISNDGAAPQAPGTQTQNRERQMPLVNLIFFGIAGVVFLILFITNPTLAIYLLANIMAGGGRGRGGFGGGGGGFGGGGGRSGGGGASGSW